MLNISTIIRNRKKVGLIIANAPEGEAWFGTMKKLSLIMGVKETSLDKATVNP